MFRWLLSSLNHQLSPSAKLAASPGFAPGPPVSETGALLITPRGNGSPGRSSESEGWSPGKVLPLRLLGVGQTRYYFTTGRKLAASLGFAPRPTGSKPDMLLLHHQARNWWPARVTLPVQRIKSPLHHFNACRPKWCSRQDSHPHWRRSRRRVLVAACKGLDYASGQNVSSSRCCSGGIALQIIAICRLLLGGVEWPAEPRLNKRRLACLAVAARRRLVAASGAAPDTAGL